MYPENKNSHTGRNVAIGVVVFLVFAGLFAGCISVFMRFSELEENGKLDRWLAENSEEEDLLSEYGYYDEDEVFHYYGEDDEEDGFGYYDEDGEFHYFDEDTDYRVDPKELFDRPTHDEDIEGYATGEYFSLPAENIVDGLAYTVEIVSEEYEDEDNYGTAIYYDYPVVSGDVPNVDYINDTICAEWESLIEYYEEEYRDYIVEEGDGIIGLLQSNVAYMSEDILSIVYQESVVYGESLDYNTETYLYCLNFDMKNGQLLEKTGMLDIDEDFVEEFRERSLKQNADSVLDYYNDDEVMELLEDPYSLILFYCPQGMEIGINVEEGWVTVTYADYEEYLKKF